MEAREKFEKAVNLMEADNRMKKTMWGQFWSAHQVHVGRVREGGTDLVSTSGTCREGEGGWDRFGQHIRYM